MGLRADKDVVCLRVSAAVLSEQGIAQERRDDMHPAVSPWIQKLRRIYVRPQGADGSAVRTSLVAGGG